MYQCPCPEEQFLGGQKNPRRGYRPKIAGILFVCNEPEANRKVNTILCPNRWGDSYERCQWWHHMIPKYERNNFLRAKHDTLHCLMSRWFAKHPPCPPKSFTRLPGNTKKLTFYEPAKLLTEQGTHLSLIKSYQLTFHLYSWLVLQF